jgi:hypothetical protein
MAMRIIALDGVISRPDNPARLAIEGLVLRIGRPGQRESRPCFLSQTAINRRRRCRIFCSVSPIAGMLVRTSIVCRSSDRFLP